MPSKPTSPVSDARRPRSAPANSAPTRSASASLTPSASAVRAESTENCAPVSNRALILRPSSCPLDPETKRLRRLSPGALADEALALKKRIDAIKDEAIRRRLKTAEGEAGRITLSPPGSQDRTERELLLKVLEITEAEFIARFTRRVQTDWRLTIKPRRQFRQAA